MTVEGRRETIGTESGLQGNGTPAGPWGHKKTGDPVKGRLWRKDRVKLLRSGNRRSQSIGSFTPYSARASLEQGFATTNFDFEVSLVEAL